MRVTVIYKLFEPKDRYTPTLHVTIFASPDGREHVNLWSDQRTTLTGDMAWGTEEAHACGPIRGQR